MTSKSDIEALIAALDTEYQAAVKNNDAFTVDRILADDFILVTGRGKVFNKIDLLDAAKNKDVIYEQNEDTQQTVRVWGNTAVITALLWQKEPVTASPSMITFGSVIPTSALRMAGNTRSVRHLSGSQIRFNEPINP